MGDIVPIHKTLTFDDFWKECPKKEKKAIAQAKWAAITSEHGLATRTLDRDSGMYIDLTLKATPEELVKAMKAYRQTQIAPMIGYETPRYFLKDDGKYTLYPSTWLNQGRWMDSL